ncbi:T9SS type A sorting domain-containing protein [Croceimicrobium hydrocarbonivorans]|uniref:T9SS type A sorting domain-containing protein n=1 Tax=Croceimicrobium hydrocarbonivorans TaxID=2761580 RepID=A0A7H0VD71_9FLAO|nr:T9SS type A sorting domain-containing protein [Croceimicrobium hydrocarbonivorans]QNR23669.1 T9SS type A sorting domain-containing protein [Croceimicrobium hydrocarbonivorans]
MKKGKLLFAVLAFWATGMSAQIDSMELRNFGTPLEKHLYQYDAAQNIIEDLVYEYSSSSNTWLLSLKYTPMNYDANGNYAEKYKFVYNSGAWDTLNHYVYAYDADGNQTQMKNYEKNGAIWDAVEGYNHSYDLFDRRTSTIRVQWDGKYKFRLRVYSGHDAKKNHTIYRETYNSATPSGGTDRSNFDLMMALVEADITWKNSASDPDWWYGYTQAFTYTNNDQNESQERVTGKPENTYQDKYKWERTYDANGTILSEVAFEWNGADPNSGTWNAPSDSLTYHYYVTSGVGLNEWAMDLHFYPNPVQDRMQIEAIGAANLQIFDMSGVKVKELHLNGNQEIDLADLKAGLYLIRLEDQASTFQGRFVKL